MNNKRKFYKKKNKKFDLNYEPKGDPKSLETLVEEMGLHEKTVALLKANQINKAYDIAKRNIKQLYKIQGFGKKDLIGIERAFGKLNLTLAPEEIKVQQNTQKNEKPKVEKSKVEITKVEKKINVEKKPVERKENKTVVLNKNNKRKNTNNELKRINRNGKIGWAKGKEIIIPAQYDEVFRIKEDMVCVELKDHFGYINLKNEMIVEPIYDLASSFSEGLACVCQNEKCGYIDKTGNLVIPLKFEKATSFENGKAKAKYNGRWITILPDGETK